MAVLPGPYRVAAMAATCVTMATTAAHALLRMRGGTPRPCEVHTGHAAEAFRSERHTRVTGAKPPKLWAPLSGEYRTADGWVRLHANYPHHATAIRTAFGDDPAPAVARLPAVEVEEAVLAAGGAAAAMRTREDWLTNGPGTAVREEPLVALDRIDDAPPRDPSDWPTPADRPAPARMGLSSARGTPDFDTTSGHRQFAAGERRERARESLSCAGGTPDFHATSGHRQFGGELRSEGGESVLAPLAGVRVLDLTHVIAGPVCGRVLAAHGADVLHVTPPGRPVLLDLVRDTDFGKRQCTIGLGEELRALAGHADVFIQSYRPDSLAHKGFSPEDLAGTRPGIVVVSLSAYGHTGPWRARRGFDSLVQMSCGIAAHAGMDKPRPLPAQALDHGTGWLAAYGVMTALRRRAVEGGSWHVRLSLARTAEWLHDLGRQAPAPVSEVDVTPFLTETESDFGTLTHIRVPCASVELAGPRKPGRDPATWW